MKKILIASLLIAITRLPALAQTDTLQQLADTTHTTLAEPVEGGAYALVFGTILIAFACVMLGTILAVCVIILMAVGLLMALLAGGIVLAALLHGWYQQSVSAGFRALVYTAVPVLSALASAATFWVLNIFMHWHLSNAAVLSIGLAGGAAGGLLVSWLVIKVGSHVLRYLLGNKQSH